MIWDQSQNASRVFISLSATSWHLTRNISPLNSWDCVYLFGLYLLITFYETTNGFVSENTKIYTTGTPSPLGKTDKQLQLLLEVCTDEVD